MYIEIPRLGGLKEMLVVEAFGRDVVVVDSRIVAVVVEVVVVDVEVAVHDPFRY